MGYRVRFDTLRQIFLLACVNIDHHIKFKFDRSNSVKYHTGLVTPILILHCYAEKLYEKRPSIHEVIQNQSQDNSSGKILTVRDTYTGGHRSHLKGCELDYDLIGNESRWDPIKHIKLTKDILVIGEILSEELAIFRVGCYIFPVNDVGIERKTRNYQEFLNNFESRRKCIGKEVNDSSKPCVGGSPHLGACKSGWENPSHRYGPSSGYRQGQRKVFFGRNPSQARSLSHRLVRNIKRYPGLLSRSEMNDVAETVKRRLKRIDSIEFRAEDPADRSDNRRRRPASIIFAEAPRYIRPCCQDPSFGRRTP